MGFLSHDIFLARLLYLISVVYKNTSCVFPHTSPHNEELLTAHILQLCKVLQRLFCQKRTWPQAYQWSARTSVSCAFWLLHLVPTYMSIKCAWTVEHVCTSAGHSALYQGFQLSAFVSLVLKNHSNTHGLTTLSTHWISQGFLHPVLHMVKVS